MKYRTALEAVLAAAEELIRCYMVNGTDDIEKAYDDLKQRVAEAKA